MSFDVLKQLLPDHCVRTRIWRGPFRGAHLVMNPRQSLRKILGIYEHELNAWLRQGVGRVSRVLDVGANDGYFSFGCAAAFRRLGIKGEITSFEPEVRHVQALRESSAVQGPLDVRIQIIQTLVGREVGEGMITLDALNASDRRNTLIKIDVEGAEMEVIAGAHSWMNASNVFVIEVHKREYLRLLQEMFTERGLRLVQVNQRPLPLLGAENREETNCWLVSDLCT